MPLTDHTPGTPVLENHRKWDGTEHWQVEGILLGTDKWGTWVGFPANTRMQRPGHDFSVPHARVTLFPPDQGWVASFWSSGDSAFTADIYIDLASVPRWTAAEGLVVSMIDLDLDVVRQLDGHVFVDDEDEFTEHAGLFGYPADVLTQAPADAARLVDLVCSQTPPFDTATRAGWEQVMAVVAP